jgi:hypothetical protein
MLQKSKASPKLFQGIFTEKEKATKKLKKTISEEESKKKQRYLKQKKKKTENHLIETGQFLENMKKMVK